MVRAVADFTTFATGGYTSAEAKDVPTADVKPRLLPPMPSPPLAVPPPGNDVVVLTDATFDDKISKGIWLIKLLRVCISWHIRRLFDGLQHATPPGAATARACPHLGGARHTPPRASSTLPRSTAPLRRVRARLNAFIGHILTYFFFSHCWPAEHP